MAQPIVLNFDMNLGARPVAKRFAYAMDWTHIESKAHQTCGVQMSGVGQANRRGPRGMVQLATDNTDHSSTYMRPLCGT